jgi:molybdate transport system substrate-binding protein
VSIRSLLLVFAVFSGALLASPLAGRGEEVLVGVATNFASAIERLEPEFETLFGHDLVVTSASTGKLYAQIVHGAPFQVLLAADQARPARLVSAGLAVGSTIRTYAIGRLVLWSPDPRRLSQGGRRALEEARFRKLAIANPDLAPYGAAARKTLIALGLESRLEDRIVMGENIGQTFSLVATGNAELGFVAASQAARAGGSGWSVPQELHDPIRQDAVLLNAGAESVAARSFLDFLETSAARSLIRDSGYEVE